MHTIQKAYLTYKSKPKKKNTGKKKTETTMALQGNKAPKRVFDTTFEWTFIAVWWSRVFSENRRHRK